MFSGLLASRGFATCRSVAHPPQGELPRPVAAHEVAGRDRLELRALVPAHGRGVRASGMEVAPKILQ